ncbi:hypothetical protein [Mycobacterium sp. NPDC050041]|uniref:hypothetical protein n=1 Tax=Mycobacterium sp. NPDC050041 TaxID=3364293 RepID=UPI003C2CDC5B
MTTPTPHPRTAIALRLTGGTLAAVTGGAWLWCVVTALTSRFASAGASMDPDSVAFDPHGFGLIFGTLFAVPLGLVCALTLPLAFPRVRRAGVRSRAMATFGVLTAALFVAVFSG